LRARLRATQDVWLLPNVPAVRPIITEGARATGDRVIDTAPFAGPATIRPTLAGYRAVVALLPPDHDAPAGPIVPAPTTGALRPAMAGAAAASSPRSRTTPATRSASVEPGSAARRACAAAAISTGGSRAARRRCGAQARRSRGAGGPAPS